MLHFMAKRLYILIVVSWGRGIVGREFRKERRCYIIVALKREEGVTSQKYRELLELEKGGNTLSPRVSNRNAAP